MKEKTTYILCPDRSCNLFNSTRIPGNHCDGSCPHEKEQKKLFLCPGCGEIVELSGWFSPCQYTTHEEPGCGILIKRAGWLNYELVRK